MLRGVLLLAETAMWHWFVVLGLLLGGSLPRLVMGLLWAAATASAVLVLAHTTRPRRALALYLGVSRFALLASQVPGAWIAWHIAPLACVAGALAAAWVILRRPGGLSPIRGCTLAIGVIMAVDGAWYGKAGIAAECRAALESEVVSPVLLFEALGAQGEEDPRYEPDCRTGRTLEVDPLSGRLLLACGTDPRRVELDAMIEVDPDAPEDRRVLRDYSAYQAVAIPEHDRIWVSIFGRHIVLGLERAGLEPRREVPIGAPYMVVHDRRAARVLVGAGGDDYGCLVALDPASGDVIARSRRPPYLDVPESSCSPADIGLLPEIDRIVVPNFVGSLSLNVFRYSDLELIGARHRAIPMRDAVVAPQGDRVWIAIPFLGRIEELDEESLAGFERPESSWLRILPGFGHLDPPGSKAFPEARRIESEFGAAYLDAFGEGALVLGNYMLGTLRRLDLASGERTEAVPVGRLVRDVTYDAARGRLFSVSACGLLEIDPAALGGTLGE